MRNYRLTSYENDKDWKQNILRNLTLIYENICNTLEYLWIKQLIKLMNWN